MDSNRSNLNPYAVAARLKKVIALADVIQDAGLHALCLGDLNDADWKQIASLAGVHQPSTDTRAAVIERLKRRASLRFGKLPERRVQAMIDFLFSPIPGFFTLWVIVELVNVLVTSIRRKR